MVSTRKPEVTSPSAVVELQRAFRASELDRSQVMDKARELGLQLPESFFAAVAGNDVVRAIRSAQEFPAEDPRRAGVTTRDAQLREASRSGTVKEESASGRRPLPDPAPALIRVGERLILKKIGQTPDMVRYVNYIKGKPTFIYVMSKHSAATALAAPTRFLEGRRALVIADRDGVVKDSRFLNQPDKQKAHDVMIPSALEAAKALNEAGVGFALATNQGGWEIGKMSFEDMIAINVRVSQQLADAGGHLDAIFICPFNGALDDPAPGDVDARKPASGMVTYGVALASARGVPTLAMVGDQVTDIAAGQGAGLKSFAVTGESGRWHSEREEAERKGKTLPAISTDPALYQEVDAFADAVRVLLA